MKRVFAAMITTGLAILLASPVWAGDGPPSLAHGTGQLTSFTITSSRTADGNTIYELQAKGFTTGTFSGPFSETDREVIHADGTVTVEGTGRASGVLGSCGSGSFTYQTELQGTLQGLSGRFQSIDEATNTVAIHTVDAFVTTGPTSFSYSGTYRCT